MGNDGENKTRHAVKQNRENDDDNDDDDEEEEDIQPCFCF